MAASSGGPTRQDTYTINVQLEDIQSGSMIDLGTWDKMTGGAVDSEDSKYYPGGMGPPISLGGRKSVDNITVSRLYRLSRDHDVVHKQFDRVGKADAIVTRHPMDINGNIWGKAVVYRGTLKRVGLPDIDSEASGAGLIELEIIVDGFPTHAD